MKRKKTKPLELLYQMLRIRIVEERIASEYKKQEMRCPTHLYVGQEAIAVGVCSSLTREDIVFSTHRSHGHYLAKGGDLYSMIAELYGKVDGCSRGYGGSQHLIDLSVNFWGSTPIVASTIPVAVGTAFASKLKALKRLTAVFFGDAANEEGVVAESLNFAALKKLPVLFVCENNLYSTNTHIADRQPHRPIYKVVEAMGLKAYQADGNDILKVKTVAHEAVQYIKKGKGPVFLEFLTYRTLEHCGPNPDAPGYRPEAEKKLWQKKDPITRYVNRLLKKNSQIDTLIEKMSVKISKELDRTFTKAQKSPYANEVLNEELVYAK